jgi:hypothetical protein
MDITRQEISAFQLREEARDVLAVSRLLDRMPESDISPLVRELPAEQVLRAILRVSLLIAMILRRKIGSPVVLRPDGMLRAGATAFWLPGSIAEQIREGLWPDDMTASYAERVSREVISTALAAFMHPALLVQPRLFPHQTVLIHGDEVFFIPIHPRERDVNTLRSWGYDQPST